MYVYMYVCMYNVVYTDCTGPSLMFSTLPHAKTFICGNGLKTKFRPQRVLSKLMEFTMMGQKLPIIVIIMDLQTL